MRIISHRGYWLKSEEKNKSVAFSRSFNSGFGTETDVRDRDGKLVISHDMPNGTEIKLEDFLNLACKKNLPLAINIKADGLADKLKIEMGNARIKDWFAFDMSIPDMRLYLDREIPVFSRMSEIELTPPWIDESQGIWLDAFYDTWFDINLIDKLLSSEKRVCVVSPELHGRSYISVWKMLKCIPNSSNLLLCTDHPEKALAYFEDKND
jgi:hypothetical protein